MPTGYTQNNSDNTDYRSNDEEDDKKNRQTLRQTDRQKATETERQRPTETDRKQDSKAVSCCCCPRSCFLFFSSAASAPNRQRGAFKNNHKWCLSILGASRKWHQSHFVHTTTVRHWTINTDAINILKESLWVRVTKTPRAEWMSWLSLQKILVRY